MGPKYWVIVALVVAIFLAYLLIAKISQDHILDGDHDPLGEPPWWPPEIAPPGPGPYETRVDRTHILQTMDTVWTGEKWVYANGRECYFQNLEYRALPGCES